MLTFFTTAKPFHGHNGITQRNALKSWALLDPSVEIILVGDDEGGAEVANELGIRHEPQVERNEFGTIRIDYMFARAQAMARHNIVCYLNCDIILLPDFTEAIRRVRSEYSEFLAIGRRWDLDITEKIDFSDSRWQEKITEMRVTDARQQTDWYIDYFVFSRGLFGQEIPPFAVGRAGWDNWMVWKARQTGKPVVDISRAVSAVHQNHDYRHHPQGRKGVYKGEEAERNLQLAGGAGHLFCIGDATLRLGRKRLRRNPKFYWHFVLYRVWNPVWFAVLGLTRPLRSALGLRTRTARNSREKT